MAGSKSRTGLCGLLFGAALFAVGNATPAAADSITVTHWGAAFYGAPYAVGMAKGFFKARGVDVTGVLTSTGGGTSVRNTLAGDLPFGEVALAAAVEAINHGEPIRIIGAGVDSVADILWIAKPGSPLHSVQDLRGKKVGFTSPGSVTNMLILMALKAKGMTASDVHLVAAGGIGANLSAVLNGALDAGMTGEPTWSENEGKVQPVFWTKDVLPANMMQTVTITTTDFAQSDPAKLRALLAARADGVAYIEAHPDEAADITAAAYHGDPALYRRVFQNFVAIHYWSDGRMDYDGMNRMVEGLQIVGQQNGPVEWSKIVDTSFLPASMKAAAK
jgi:NitT/TauT family transport system substrate-binding protein